MGYFREKEKWDIFAKKVSIFAKRNFGKYSSYRGSCTALDGTDMGWFSKYYGSECYNEVTLALLLISLPIDHMQLC